MKLLVNDLKLYFGLMFLLPLTLDVISSDQDKYYAVFLLLVYRLAPRTFRLRI